MITLLLFTLTHLWAFDCTPVNLITKANSPFNKIPVYDQDGSRICYAYTIAQLVDYKKISEGASDRNVHPLWVALSYNLAHGYNSFDYGGVVNDALLDLLKNGSCPYDKVMDGLKLAIESTNSNEPHFLDFLEEYKKARMESRLDVDRSPITDLLSASANHRMYCATGNHNFLELSEELKQMDKLTSPEIIQKLLFPACENQLEKMNFEVETREHGADTVIEDKLQATLNSGRPVGISYCTNFFTDKTYDGISEKGLIKKWKRRHIKEDCHHHASLVVGRREVENRCEILIRNSWGTGLNPKMGKGKCLCRDKATGAFADNCHEDMVNIQKFTVEGCWYDSKDLARNIRSLTSLR